MSQFFSVYQDSFDGLVLRFGGVIEVHRDILLRDLLEDEDFAYLQDKQEWKGLLQCSCPQGAYFMAYTDQAGSLSKAFRRPPLLLALIAMIKLPHFPRAVFTSDAYVLSYPEPGKPFCLKMTYLFPIADPATGRVSTAGLCANAH